jgi:hypothetical protein
VIAEGIRKGHVHSGQLERWLGKEELEKISAATRDWYGPPIAVNGIPGAVYAAGGGDFVGDLRAGYEVSVYDRAWEIAKRIRRGMRRVAAKQGSTLNAGFSSLSDLIAESASGKSQTLAFDKGINWFSSSTSCGSYWRRDNLPVAAANASAAPGGDAPTKNTTGAFLIQNPASGDTLHFVGGTIAQVSGSTTKASPLLYDRIFQVDKTMNSTATEAVTGVPTRYQSTVAGAQDSAEGNFLFPEVGTTALAATAHNWTVCTYTDQGGSASTLPSITGDSPASTHQLDFSAARSWFAPLETGDRGIRTLTQMQCSALVATGIVNFVIGHPVAFMGHPAPNLVVRWDGILTSFNLTRIFDNAALALLDVGFSGNTAPTLSGNVRLVAG